MKATRKHKATSSTAAKSDEKPEAPATRDMLDAAQVKLRAADAISDLVAMLEVHKAVDSLKQHTLSTAMLHTGGLIEEARELIGKAEAGHD